MGVADTDVEVDSAPIGETVAVAVDVELATDVDSAVSVANCVEDSDIVAVDVVEADVVDVCDNDVAIAVAPCSAYMLLSDAPTYNVPFDPIAALEPTAPPAVKLHIT